MLKKIFATIAIIFILFANVSPVFAQTEEADGAKFATKLSWTGSDIKISWDNFRPNAFMRQNMIITVQNKATNTVATTYASDVSGEILISQTKYQSIKGIASPKEGELWQISFKTPSGNEFTKYVSCGKLTADMQLLYENEMAAKKVTGTAPSLKNLHWPVLMLWYRILASLSGVFIFYTLIRCGYQYMYTQHEGVKASVISTIQKCVVALIIIMVAPTLINLLIQINDAIVTLARNTLQQITVASANANILAEIDSSTGKTEWWGSLLAWPIQALIDMCTKLFGLTPLETVIFNQPSGLSALGSSVFSGKLNTGNVFSSAFLNASFLGFTLYFNAVYVIRKWVIMINIAVAPLVIWIWVLSEKREVIEIWLAEIIQTIFMQTFHALAFGVVFSILYCPAALPTLSFETAASAGTAFIGLGRVIAYFAGVICAGVIVFQCYHIICAINDEQRAAAQTTLGRSLIGLLIIGLSLMITTYLVGDGNMPLFYPDPTGATVVSDLTLWELFFAILTIIPVAKMLSTMFMSLLSRAAIVNEEAVAGKAMAGLAGLALLGRSSMGAVRGGGGSLPNHTTAPPGGGDRKVLNPPVPQGYDPATGGGSSPGSAYAQTMSQLGGADHQRMANNFQGKGRAAGMISGIAAGPATGAMLGGAFGAVAKTAGTMGYTGKAMASGLQLMSKNNEVKNIPLNERAQDFTGRQSAVGAWTQMGAGVILSPLGPKVSSGVSQGFGWTIDRGLGMIDALASRA